MRWKLIRREFVYLFFDDILHCNNKMVNVCSIWLRITSNIISHFYISDQKAHPSLWSSTKFKSTNQVLVEWDFNRSNSKFHYVSNMLFLSTDLCASHLQSPLDLMVTVTRSYSNCIYLFILYWATPNEQVVLILFFFF